MSLSGSLFEGACTDPRPPLVGDRITTLPGKPLVVESDVTRLGQRNHRRAPQSDLAALSSNRNSLHPEARAVRLDPQK
jgi:hypothetical protein